MNFQIFRQSKVLADLNKSLADELNQPKSFPTARSNKKIRKTKQSPKPNKTPTTQWVGCFLKNPEFFWILAHSFTHLGITAAVFNSQDALPVAKPTAWKQQRKHSSSYANAIISRHWNNCYLICRQKFHTNDYQRHLGVKSILITWSTICKSM